MRSARLPRREPQRRPRGGSPHHAGRYAARRAALSSAETHKVKRREEGEAASADSLELFFDLVFVVAITQVSHLLLSDLTWEGAGQSLIILLVVWWAWQYTTWVTNELDPQDLSVRILMLALMMGSLLMSVAIPEAFGDRALLFAGSYVAIQVGRHAFLTFAAGAPGSIERERAGRILTWFCASGVLWIAGAIADGPARTALWVMALTLDSIGPLVTFWIPGLGRIHPEAWQVGTEHFAERFGLFVIIALGESIVITGTTTSDLDITLARAGALIVAFVGTAALWWLYFSAVQRLAERGLENAEARTLMARDAYTYGHAVIIAGIILSAVGDELVIAHPGEHLHTAEMLAVAGGPAIYLLAQLGLRIRMTGDLSHRRLMGIGGCVVVGLVGAHLPALAVGALFDAVLIWMVVADQRAGPRSPVTSLVDAPA